MQEGARIFPTGSQDFFRRKLLKLGGGFKQECAGCDSHLGKLFLWTAEKELEMDGWEEMDGNGMGCSSGIRKKWIS